MVYWYNWVTWGVFAGLAAVSFLVLWAEHPRGARWRGTVERTLRRLTGRADLDWLDWRPVLAVATVAFAAVIAYGLASGAYACTPGGVSDPIGELNSGRAFWAGTNPFTVADCGGTIVVPYGLAAVLLDALGSLGGLAGIYAVWGAFALSIVPLVWYAAGPDRRIVLLFVASSVLLVPLVSSQIDGTTNAIVPAVVLLSIVVARRDGVLGAALGGFLSTARFPNLFPVLGGTGAGRRRYAAFFGGAAAFAAGTALAYARWGHDFLGPVFLDQIGRRSFSLNLYGVPLLYHALPASLAIEAAEAVATLALVLAAFFGFRSSVVASAFVLTGVALLTPFLSFTILVWLLPVALVSARARLWLWGIGVVGSVNYDVALNVWAWDDGVGWPSAVLDVVLTVLLLALFVELWRSRSADPGAGGASAGR